NPAVISTVRSDGQPVSAATWYLLRGDQVLVNLDHGRKRLEHMRKDPRVSLTVLDESDWYTHVTVIGRVTEVYDDDGLADIDALSRQYTRGERRRTTASRAADSLGAAPRPVQPVSASVTPGRVCGVRAVLRRIGAPAHWGPVTDDELHQRPSLGSHQLRGAPDIPWPTSPQRRRLAHPPKTTQPRRAELPADRRGACANAR